MGKKVWKKIELTLGSEQIITITPNLEFDNIIVKIFELGGINSEDGLCLGEKELEVFIEELKSMMNYIKTNK